MAAGCPPPPRLLVLGAVLMLVLMPLVALCSDEPPLDFIDRGSGDSEEERLVYDAIRSLHVQLDDDADGQIDKSESDEFLREELNYVQGYGSRQDVFHRSDQSQDTAVSVRELWEHWRRSAVHNWTTEETVEWLVRHVHLPQYRDTFELHHIAGPALPRLAVNNNHFLSGVLGIKDPRHKQKIMLKAMDAVLFGPPKDAEPSDLVNSVSIIPRDLPKLHELLSAEITRLGERLSDLERHVQERDGIIAELTDDLRNSRAEIAALQHRVEEAEVNCRMPSLILSGSAIIVIIIITKFIGII